MMVVCVNGMFAQTENEISNENTSIEADAGDDGVGAADDVSATPNKTYLRRKMKKNSEHRFADSATELEAMEVLWQKFSEYDAEAQNEERILTEVPVMGKTKFTRRHYITQRLEISVIGGTDIKDGEGSSVKNDYDSPEDGDKSKPGFNWGLNFGYSLVFAPGRVEGNKLYLNRFGIAYSTGLIASFDKQDKYGTTCDFLLKLGIEAGHGHPMGIGFDLLVGTGKSAGEYNFTLEDNEAAPNNNEPEEMNVPYTMWCFKYGAQLWLRSNLLRAKVKNTDVRLFARYVYSKNPENEDELFRDGIFCDWHEEGWSFGMTFCYTF